MKCLVYISLFTLVFALAFGLMVEFSFAQGGQTGPGSGEEGGQTGPGSGEEGGQTGGGTVVLMNPTGSGTITELVNNITSALITLTSPIVAIMVLIGAFQILSAAGDPEKFKRGKRTILYTVIGYAIILVASGITSIIESILTKAES